MKQVLDKNGNRVNGLFKTDGGSIVVKNQIEFNRSRSQTAAFDNINNELNELKSQMTYIIGLLNGRT